MPSDAPVIGHLWEFSNVGEALEGCYNSAGRCIVPPKAKKRALPNPVYTLGVLKSGKQAVSRSAYCCHEVGGGYNLLGYVLLV